MHLMQRAFGHEFVYSVMPQPLASFQDHGLIACNPALAMDAPSQDVIADLFRTAAALSLGGQLGRSAERLVIESSVVQLPQERNHPAVAKCLQFYEAVAAQNPDKLRWAEESDWFISGILAGEQWLDMHAHGVRGDHDEYGGIGHGGYQRDVADGCSTFQLCVRACSSQTVQQAAADRSFVALQSGNRAPILAAALAHGSAHGLDRDGQGETTSEPRPDDGDLGARLKRVNLHGVHQVRIELKVAAV